MWRGSVGGRRFGFGSRGGAGLGGGAFCCGGGGAVFGVYCGELFVCVNVNVSALWRL